MDDLLKEFLTETNENLNELDESLVSLEHNPNDEQLIGKIFRVMHTIKGTCGFLGLSRLEKIAHSGENILGKIRDKELPVDQQKISLILEVLDIIKGILTYIETHSQEPQGDDSVLLSRLEQALKGASSPVSIEANPKTEAVAATNASQESKAEAATVTEVAVMDAPKDNGLVQNDVKAAATENKGEAQKASSVVNQTIRVNLNVLEGIMQFVSELVLTRNQLQQLMRKNTNDVSKFSTSIQRLNHITSELQEKVMKTRMQPIENTWAPFTRLVRDLSIELGKKVELCKIGGETELDRQLIESIKDPLTDMVRNSIDHGIELPEVRKKIGKPEVGRVTLKAYHQGGHIIIEIEDDGKGLDVAKIRQKAVERGLIQESDSVNISDQQIMQFIFLPGFSTAEKVTAVSGRGVGMDVVKTNIEKISGTVELRSEFGKGSTMVIKIPLTLAIMSVLIVGASGRKFGIPQINIIEMVRVGERSAYKLENLNNNLVLRLRGKLLPLLSLNSILGIGFNAEEQLKKCSYVVVCEINGTDFGILVDKIYDTEEIVVKPVAPVLKTIDVYSGSTLLGDGSVIMILEMASILKIVANIKSSSNIDNIPKLDKAKIAESQNLSSFLIMNQFSGKRIAVPLELVARLEKVEVKDIELSGNRKVVQYRDNFMHLVNLDEMEWPNNSSLQCAVFIDGDKMIGIIVKEIIDIVEEDVKAFTKNDMPLSLGSIVIGGHTTDLIDVPALFEQMFFKDIATDAIKLESIKKKPHILLIDDSAFFRKFMPPTLEKLGYKVTSVDRANKALELLNSPESYNIIITDLNMPGMSGIEFAEAYTKNKSENLVPIIALSSNVSEKVKYNFEELGFTACVSKTNHDELARVLTDLSGR
ncbi:MAG: cheA [Rickettsiaceae bacterium]|jgi:two-component system chemotaxis sensor kinase CheA|nr:cheA [Rickettsiaceae bacterium]